jgi:lipopolysaccharide exporter
MNTESINKQIAKGAVWMVALRLSVLAIASVSTIVLARLLTPDDFGIVAMTSSIYALVELLRAFGFDTVLIQNQGATKEDYNTAWTIQVIFSLIASTIVLLISELASDFYGDQRLLPALNFIALIFLVNGFNNIGIVNFRKNMTFNKEFSFHLSIKLIGFCVTIPLAFLLKSYWALLYGMLATNVASVIMSYKMEEFRPRITLIAWKKLLGFSSWLFINNILTFISSHSQNFILGKTSGSESLGSFSIAKEISTLTTAQLVAPINRAAYPGYSKVAHDIERLKDSYFKVLSHIILFAVPSAIGVSAISPLLVPVLLGQKWIEIVPLIQIIALASIFRSITTNSHYVFLAMAKQRLTTLLLCIYLLIFIPLLLWLTSEKGATGAAIAIFIASLIIFPINLLVLKKQINFLWENFFQIAHRPLIAALGMGFFVHNFVNSAVTLNQSLFDGIISLISALLIGVFSFTIFLTVIWFLTGKKEGVEKELANKIYTKIKFFI